MLIGVEIDEPERDGVARGEVAQAVRVRREARSDDLRALESLADEQRATHQERLHDHFAELGDLVDAASQLVGVQLDDGAIRVRASGDERAPAGQRVDIAGELPGLVHPHESLGAAGAFDDCDSAFDDYIEAEIAVTLGEQHVACVHGAPMPATRERFEVGAAEDWKRDLLFAGHLLTWCGVACSGDLGGSESLCKLRNEC